MVTIKEGICKETKPGKWEIVGEIEYHVSISGDRLTVNGKALPIMYQTGYCFRLLKTRIYSLYAPDEFLSKFFISDTSWSEKICKHVLKYGKSA